MHTFAPIAPRYDCVMQNCHRTALRLSISLCICLACAVYHPLPASANGYDVYASPLCWSPDGQYLAAVVAEGWPVEDELVPGEMRLYTRDGRYSVLATGDSLGSPSFSADSHWLAFIHDGWLVAYEQQPDGSWSGGDCFNGARDCRCAGNGVGPEGVLLTSGERFYGCNVLAFDLTSMEAQPLVPAAPEASLFSPLISPAGTTLLALFQDSLDEHSVYERIVRFDPASGSFIRLCQPEAREWDYHESNFVFVDDDTLLFQRGGWGDWRLYRYELAAGREYLEAGDAQQPSISGDGRYLAFTRRDPQLKAQAEYDWEVPPTVWLRDRQRGAERQLSKSGAAAEFPAISPDGGKVAWLQMGTTEAVSVIIRSRPALWGS
jgi:hypothetical protein